MRTPDSLLQLADAGLRALGETALAGLDAALRSFCPTPCLTCHAPRGPVCPACRQRLGPEDLRAAPATRRRPLHLWLDDYGGPLRQLIHTAKFRRDELAAEALARVVGDKLARRPGLLAPVDALVHPPVEAGRRSFHPAVVLARHLGARFRLPVLGELVVRRPGAQGVRRVAREERARHVGASLWGGRPPPARVRRVLLVDDLVTTGATGERMGALLHRRGVETLAWLSLARAVKRSDPGEASPETPPQEVPSCLGGKKVEIFAADPTVQDPRREPVVRLMGLQARGNVSETCAP